MASTVSLIRAVDLSRAVVAAAADLVAGIGRVVTRDGTVRTARDNAWEAVQADRARAQARADMARLVAGLVADGPAPAAGPAAAAPVAGGAGQSAVGSSPRSSASHAALVSAGR